jgi:hypothetical protein
MHNKPQGCGASVASAAGPFTTKKARSCGHDKEISDSIKHKEFLDKLKTS